MTTLPVPNFFTTVAPSNLEAKQAFDDMNACIRQLPGGNIVQGLAIAGGFITPTRTINYIDTEGGTANDDLTNIITTNMPDGSLIILAQWVTGHVVKLKNGFGGAGQMFLYGGVDYTMTSGLFVLLNRQGANWGEIKFR